MCGFLGEVTSRERDPGDWTAEATLRALRHRGPDGEGTFEDLDQSPTCRLVHTRLAIIDPRRVASQPMTDHARGLTLAFNGEIYNYRELRSELLAGGERFATESDTEVLLRAFGVWGRACLSRLRGMFAFAVWDARARRLTLARDRFGIKPLYVRLGQDGVLFASEVRAVLAAGVPRALSPRAIESFLAYGAVWSGESIVRGVDELDPGTVLVYEGGQVTRERYWTLDSKGASLPPTSLGGAVQIVSPMLREAVALQLRSDVPLGIFLSAGLDSSALAALACEALGSPPITLTVNFEGPGAEGDEARAIAQALGTDHRQIDVSLDQAAAWVPEAVASMDQPSVDGVNSWIVSRAAREAGLKVCLSGLGGDEVFAGYDTFRRFGRFLRLGHLVGPLGSGVRAFQRRLPFSRWRADGTARKAAWLLSERGDPAGSYAVLRALFAPEQAAALWPGFDRERGHRREVRSDSLPSHDPVNQLSRLELINYLRGTLLRDADAMSMSHGVEVRPPLLDERLAEAVLALPGNLKLQAGISKPLLWGCVEGRLPAALPRRRKTGFTLPFDAWLDGALRDWHRQGLRAALDLGLSPNGVRQLEDSRSHGALAWHRWFAPAVLGHWAARNRVRP